MAGIDNKTDDVLSASQAGGLEADINRKSRKAEQGKGKGNATEYL